MEYHHPKVHDWSEDEGQVLKAVTLVSASISLVTSLLLLAMIIFRLCNQTLANTTNLAHFRERMFSRFLLHTAMAELLVTIGHIMGAWSAESTSICKWQALLLIGNEFASIFWTGAIVIFILMMVILPQSETVRELSKWYHLEIAATALCWGLPLLLLVFIQAIPGIVDRRTPSAYDFLCWFSSDSQAYAWFFFFGPFLLLVTIYSLCLVIAQVLYIKKRKQFASSIEFTATQSPLPSGVSRYFYTNNSTDDESSETFSEISYTEKVEEYSMIEVGLQSIFFRVFFLASLLMVYSPSLVRFIITSAGVHYIFPIHVIELVFLPLQGFFNFCLYSILIWKWFYLLAKKQYTKLMKKKNAKKKEKLHSSVRADGPFGTFASDVLTA